MINDTIKVFYQLFKISPRHVNIYNEHDVQRRQNSLWTYFAAFATLPVTSDDEQT